MSGVQMMAWAFAQIARCVSACFYWFDSLMIRLNGNSVLIFMFFIGLLVSLFLRPIIGFGINAIGADTVNAVYGKYKLDRDIKAAKRSDAIRFISRRS